jgi:hypothetical protein
MREPAARSSRSCSSSSDSVATMSGLRGASDATRAAWYGVVMMNAAPANVLRPVATLLSTSGLASMPTHSFSSRATVRRSGLVLVDDGDRRGFDLGNGLEQPQHRGRIEVEGTCALIGVLQPALLQLLQRPAATV